MREFGKYVTFYGDDLLSNFAPAVIKAPDDFFTPSLWQTPDDRPIITYKTSEAYYQSRKALFAGDEKSYRDIIEAEHPARTKFIARNIDVDPKRWYDVKVGYMRDVIEKKFEQNPEMKKKLLQKKWDGKVFIEASPTDNFWGIGWSEDKLERFYDMFGCLPNQRGQNMLGVLIGEYRNNALKKRV